MDSLRSFQTIWKETRGDEGETGFFHCFLSLREDLEETQVLDVMAAIT